MLRGAYERGGSGDARHHTVGAACHDHNAVSLGPSDTTTGTMGIANESGLTVNSIPRRAPVDKIHQLAMNTSMLKGVAPGEWRHHQRALRSRSWEASPPFELRFIGWVFHVF